MDDESNGEEGTELEVVIGAYVEPTVEGMPPRARIMLMIQTEGGEAVLDEQPVVWNGDMGQWCAKGVPIRTELGEMLTEHARDLEVPGF